MTRLLSPQISLSPSSFSSGGTQVTATVSLMNRPAYHGHPGIVGLTTITPKIICSRVPSGVGPFAIMVSGSETSCNAGNPYRDLHYSWDFGDEDGVEEFTDHWNNKTVNANTDQSAPDATYVYRVPGTYTITMTVKGKDESGNVITASTTSLLTLGQFFLFRGNATGGTFTLTFDGQTTSAIDYNATAETVLAALHALSNLDSANCRLTGQENIEFFGPLAGQSYTFTLDSSSLTGNTGTPLLRADIVSGTSATVTVADLTGWTIQYFDSTYDGSNGVADGTESRPYTTFAAFESFVEGGDTRCAKVKRGSTFNAAGATVTQSSWNIIIEAYGTGDKPVFNDMIVRCFNGNIGSALRTHHVWSNVEIYYNAVQPGGNIANSIFEFESSSNGNTVNAYGRAGSVLFDNLDCSFGPNIDNTNSPSPSVKFDFIRVTGFTNRGVQWNDVHIWGGTYDSNVAGGDVFAPTVTQWMSITGASTLDGYGSEILQHSTYPKVDTHSWYRWVSYGPPLLKNYAVNNNARANKFWACRYHGFDGCLIVGGNQGLDFSNTGNLGGGYMNRGYFDEVVLQFNRISTLGITENARHGVLCYNLVGVTMRWNNFWNCQGAAVAVAEVPGREYGVVFSVYHNNFSTGRFKVQGGQSGYFYGNTFSRPGDAVNIAACIAGPAADLANCTGDYNIYNCPGESSPIYDVTADDPLSFATWQGYGIDANATIADPLWADPTNGVFVDNPAVTVEWPEGFTNLEYSLNDGGDWASYVNLDELSVGTSLPSYAEVLFRANTPAQNGVFEIDVTSSATSLETIDEYDSANLTGVGVVQYIVIAASGLHLVLSVAAG